MVRHEGIEGKIGRRGGTGRWKGTDVGREGGMEEHRWGDGMEEGGVKDGKYKEKKT